MKKLVTFLGMCLGTGLGCMAALIVFVLIAGFSWLVTCGIVYLITLCFGFTFSWITSTGIWLVIICIGGIFRTSDKE